MKSKITGGLPVFKESRRNHLVSIQVHENHFCTGVITTRHVAMSTGNCILKILPDYKKKDAQGNKKVRLCFGHTLDDPSKCSSILDIAIHYRFRPNNVVHLNGDPSIPHNLGLVMVSVSLQKMHRKRVYLTKEFNLLVGLY